MWKLKLDHQLQSHRLHLKTRMFYFASDIIWFFGLSFSSLQNKLKKIKEKYKDQDEEDRELMMQLLAVRMKEGVAPALRRNNRWTSFFSPLVPPRMRRRRGKRERKGRGKKNPPENPPLWKQPLNLVRWRLQRRTQRRREERKRQNRKERKEVLQNKRRR